MGSKDTKRSLAVANINISKETMILVGNVKKAKKDLDYAKANNFHEDDYDHYWFIHHEAVQKAEHALLTEFLAQV
jgi:hypothetical protein